MEEWGIVEFIKKILFYNRDMTDKSIKEVLLKKY